MSSCCIGRGLLVRQHAVDNVLWSLTSMLACRMFQLLRSFTGLQEEGGDAPAADHYLYFRGIPNPPDDYLPPTGASPNT